MKTVTLKADESGQLWTENIEQWKKMCSGEACSICQAGGGPHPENGFAETGTAWVDLARHNVCLGAITLLSKVHVVEPFDLPKETQALFFLECMSAAKGLQNALNPIKLNYEARNNIQPHLHFKIYPRMPDDDYVGFPIHYRNTYIHTDEEIQSIQQAVRKQLAAEGYLKD